jgi:hypothetical protein
MSNIHDILIFKLNKNIHSYNYYKCFDIDYIIKDTLIETKSIILQYIKERIYYPLDYYFKNSIDYAIHLDIIQLKADGCLFSDLDINDIYIEHLPDIKQYLYNYSDIIN